MKHRETSTPTSPAFRAPAEPARAGAAVGPVGLAGSDTRTAGLRGLPWNYHVLPEAPWEQALLG